MWARFLWTESDMLFLIKKGIFFFCFSIEYSMITLVQLSRKSSFAPLPNLELAYQVAFVEFFILDESDIH